ncbi:MAG: hypothetical protein LUG18_07890 [Candidatus Azobacteroides sp.]|nr:hypothetical protein [Candidatus Azobacteroides sp.]
MKKIIFLAAAFCISIMAATAQTQEYKNFQLSFISPFGTNGTQSQFTTNKVSVNIIGGYSYGNTGFEFGGIYNVNTHLTQGIQFAGILNYSGNTQRAIQLAGITNVAKKGTVNAQVGGIVNIAQRVKGVQVGLINISEDCDGVPVGLINIVKNGGKKEFELSVSETLNMAVGFKLGVDRFYTIFSVGANYFNSPVEYAAGLGFGTHIDWKQGWGNQIELLGYALTEDGEFRSGVNMLTQLKFLASKEISPRLKVFAGPVLNLTISDYVNPDTGKLGSSLSPWSMWKNDSDKTRVNSWIGVAAGIRF